MAAAASSLSKESFGGNFLDSCSGCANKSAAALNASQSLGNVTVGYFAMSRNALMISSLVIFRSKSKAQ
jgi:hypothetical protein